MTAREPARDWVVTITHPAGVRGPYGYYTGAEARGRARAYEYPAAAFPAQVKPAGALDRLIAGQDASPARQASPTARSRTDGKAGVMTAKDTVRRTATRWDPATGCTAVSPGCDNCHPAREASGRLARHPAYARLASNGKFNGRVRLRPDQLDQPLRWRHRRMILVNDRGDLFHESMPADFIARVFAVMALAGRHTFQISTRRHVRMRALLGDADFREAVAEHATEVMASRPWHRWQLDLGGQRLAGDSGLGGEWAVTETENGNLWSPPWPLHNVWVGVPAENQEWADIRIPALLDTPAAVRYVACEPLLGPVSLRGYLSDPPWIDGALWPPSNARERSFDWVIIGGEHGRGARRMTLQWAEDIVADCQAAQVPAFVTQLGTVTGRGWNAGIRGADFGRWPRSLQVRNYPRPQEAAAMSGTGLPLPEQS